MPHSYLTKKLIEDAASKGPSSTAPHKVTFQHFTGEVTVTPITDMLHMS